MPNSLSAKKRVRQNVKRRARNRWRKGQIKDAVREFNEALHAGKTDKAAELLRTVYKQLDRTAGRGTIHKNAAARKKARLSKALAAASQK